MSNPNPWIDIMEIGRPPDSFGWRGWVVVCGIVVGIVCFWWGSCYR